MIFLLLSLFSFKTFTAEPLHWSQLLEISEKHEFYKNHEIISKPRDSWQELFGLIYLDKNIKRLKDCVFYRVPGEEAGKLKIKTIRANEKCEDNVLKPGDREFSEIKSLQFALSENELKIDINFNDFRNEKWEARMQTSYSKPKAVMNLSSAEYKSPKIVFLASGSHDSSKNKKTFLKPDSLCHDINEDCEEVKPSNCDDCETGWYEIPNGCQQGPKYCGIHQCGKKGKPACRRGMVWQKNNDELDCRTNSSFAYCAKGLTVLCEGKKAFCN